MNNLSIIGRMTKDPEIKVVNSKMLCRFSIAVKRVYQKDKTDFFNCSLWGKQAEFVADYCKKGELVSIVGSVHIDKHEDKYYTSINCNNVQKLTPKPKEDSGDSAAPF